MVIAKRDKVNFYLRKIDENGAFVVYREPVPARLNLFPTTAESDLIALGAEYREYMRARIGSRAAEKYHVGDLIYDSEPVFNDSVDIGNATYRVNAILPVLNVTEILCKRMSEAE